MSTTITPPVRKSIEVSVPPERAWEAFTAEIGAWWPTDTHALSPGEVAELVLEGRVGGQWYELTTTGARNLVATVLAWEPPALLRVEWQVSGDPTTEIEVRFTPCGTGTRVELEHGGWPDEERRGSYDEGWEMVLGRYAAHAG